MDTSKKCKKCSNNTFDDRNLTKQVEREALALFVWHTFVKCADMSSYRCRSRELWHGSVLTGSGEAGRGGITSYIGGKSHDGFSALFLYLWSGFFGTGGGGLTLRHTSTFKSNENNQCDWTCDFYICFLTYYLIRMSNVLHKTICKISCNVAFFPYRITYTF